MIRRATLCFLCFLGSAAAQDQSLDIQTFHQKAQLVQVPVKVTDKSGRYIDGLLASEFSVLDNGVRQKITLDDFGTGLPPISLVIAIQTSGISTPALAKIRRIGSMIEPYVTGARGEAAVVTFDSRVRWLQDFTSDGGKVQHAVNTLKTGPDLSQARMLDAVVEAAGRMKEREGRKMLLLISENRDRGSATKIQQALETVTRDGVEVFGAHYSAFATAWVAKPKDQPDLSSPPENPPDPDDFPQGPHDIDFMAIFAELIHLGSTNVIEALTQATGGSDFPFLRERGIENAIEKLGVEVHSQYVVSFAQRESPAGLHQVEVSIPSRGDLQLKWRRTYWADSPDPK